MVTVPAITRRAALKGAATLGLTVVSRPVLAEPEAMQQAIRDYVKGAPLKAGKVRIDIAPLVENGNAVSIGVAVDHPMTAADHVREIALFSEKNPLPEMVVFHLGPRAGRADVTTRIRLATTQHVVAIARLSDGSCWSETREVIVTVAACTEE